MPDFQNSLLARLPRAEQDAIERLCETVPLEFGDVLYQPGEPTTHVYFPTRGYLSLIASQLDTPKLEVGMVGAEGFVGSQLALGVDSAPWLVVVQGDGSAARMAAADFQAFLEASPALREILQHYVAALMAQFSIAAPCLRFHDISQRLARWLLMTQDRAGLPEFKATHEYLSYMLGVRRAGVSEAAGELQRLGAIHYARGLMQILDRGRLEAASCNCYASDCASYRAAMA